MNTDSIPLISQSKSLYHLLKGNKAKAKEIQSTFSKQCIGVSQIRSVVEALSGNAKAAKRTQDEFTSTAPLIAQIRSGIEVSIGKPNDAIKTQEKYINNLIGSRNTEHKIRLKVMTAPGRTGSTDAAAEGTQTERAVIEVPDEFICPITWEIMDDPVICSDGNTYERRAIQDWLYQNDTSPHTNMPLEENKLIPNRALKHMIDAWKVVHRYDEMKIVHTDHENVVNVEEEKMEVLNAETGEDEDDEVVDDLLDALDLEVNEGNHAS